MFDIEPTTPPPQGRGCGERDEECPYCCSGTSPFGSPIEFFVVDPAIPWPGKFQRGTKILPRNSKDPNSINDLVIFVGEGFYKSPWDMVEESKRFGTSRKVSPTLPFEKLTPMESRMVFVHARAIPKFTYKLDRDPRPLYGCKQFQRWVESKAGGPPETHADGRACTHGLRDLAIFNHTLEEITILASEEEGDQRVYFRINLPSFSYGGTLPALPEVNLEGGKPDLDWQIGIFMALPLTHIEFVRKPHPKAQERVKAAGFQSIIMEK